MYMENFWDKTPEAEGRTFAGHKLNSIIVFISLAVCSLLKLTLYTRTHPAYPILSLFNLFNVLVIVLELI